MIHEFSRTERLIGPDALNRLSSSTVLVFGAGGVGSHCIEALARSGIGHLLLVDPDPVSITNINRQSIAFHSTTGRYKTHVMKERILDINPKAVVDTWEIFILPENLDPFFDSLPGPVDYIIDAIDTVSAKLAIAGLADSRQIPLIASMGTGNKLHPELFEITDIGNTSVCPLCKVMRRELKRLGIPRLTVLYSREKPIQPALSCEEETGKRSVPASISFVPPVAGLLIAGHVIRDLAGIS
ncbi:MAG: tRNA threonylcarbamoyladenosine dehydratase [Hungatella sp.]|jgi:tRNA A37 threonylcarbamoyladenosine dehydratase|nr:tRNA threonylcarbamoyladenosine dehydratase [Hungatella sp.]